MKKLSLFTLSLFILLSACKKEKNPIVGDYIGNGFSTTYRLDSAIYLHTGVDSIYYLDTTVIYLGGEYQNQINSDSIKPLLHTQERININLSITETHTSYIIGETGLYIDKENNKLKGVYKNWVVSNTKVVFDSKGFIDLYFDTYPHDSAQPNRITRYVIYLKKNR